MSDLVRLLSTARDHIAEVGLHKGSNFGPGDVERTGPCCAYGAIIWARDSLGLESYDSGDALHFVGGRLTPHASLVSFNDRPDTTLADVVHLFDRAIQAASIEVSS